MKQSLYRLFFLISTIEGILAFLWIFRVPSMERNAGILGYSPMRLALAAGAIFPLLALAVVIYKSFADQTWLERLDDWLALQLGKGHRLLFLLLFLAFAFLVGVSFLLIWTSPLIHDYAWYSVTFKHQVAFYETFLAVSERAISLFVWLLAFILQVFVLVAINFVSVYRQAGYITAKAVYTNLLVVAMIFACLLQWMILSMQIPIFTNIPGWYWDFQPKGFHPQDGLFFVLLALALLVVRVVLKSPRKVGRNLILLIATGYLLQVGFGWIDGRGFEAIRLKYADSLHRSYAVTVTSSDLNPIEVVRNYEERFGLRMFPSTKPPGVILMYLFAERIVNFIDPQPTSDGRFIALTTWMAYIFPLFTFLTVAAIYFFIRPLVNAEDALLPGVLYLFLPDIILIPLFLDQVAYPMLFLLGAFLVWQAVVRRSILLSFLAGVYFYIAIFFTFSMLPLLPFFLLFVVIDAVLNFRKNRLFQPIKTVLGIAAGILVMFVLLRVTLNYSFFSRYDMAMRVVRNFDFVLRVGKPAPEDYYSRTIQPSLSQILGAGRLNLTEFAAAVGFPIFLLFLSRGIKIIVAFVKKEAGLLDGVLGVFFGTFLALNLYGQVQGEVSRLWMFWTPMVVMFAGVEIVDLFKRKEMAVALLIIAQMITIYLTFHFQDFIV